MAKEKKTKKAAAPAAKAEETKKAKKVLSPEEKKAKAAKRREALKNRPAGQRPNSKQIDVIQTENGGEVKTYGYAIKGKGVMVTTVAFNPDGEVVSTSIAFVPGPFAVKTKKGHGYIKFVKGMTAAEAADEENDDEEEDED